MNILEVQNLSKSYPNGVQALKDVSFHVKKGEFLVIIGLSGSGKSTLLRCLNHMHPATSGEILFKNTNVTQIKGVKVRELRTKMAMIFQHFNLIPRHSVLKNALTGTLGKMGSLKSVLGLFSDEDKENAFKALSLVGIKHKAFLRADELSGGQQQRVAIARALMQHPEVLLADEPVASLDPATCHTVMDYLKAINKDLGLTIVCNLHFLSLVREYADRVLALKDGEIVFSGSPSEISDELFKKIYGERAKEVFVH